MMESTTIWLPLVNLTISSSTTSSRDTSSILEFLITLILCSDMTDSLSIVYLDLSSWIVLIKVFRTIIIIKVKFLKEPTDIIAIAKTILMILNKVKAFSTIISLTVFVLTSILS